MILLVKRRINRVKRRTPRRGRVIDLAYLAWCATQPCCITRQFPATTHHIRFCGSPKNDHLVIRLVERLHIHDAGMDSTERIGKEAFEARFGIDLVYQSEVLYANYRLLTEPSPAAVLIFAEASDLFSPDGWERGGF